MTPENLRKLLANVVPSDAKEAEDLARMQRYHGEPDAHFTGSAVVVDATGTKVCLVFHKKLQRWLQPGGHTEPGDGGSMAATALREAREETGLAVSLHPRAPRPLDVDAHLIPARQNEGAHWHLDVRYLVVAQTGALQLDPNESLELRWFSFDEAQSLTDEPALQRLLRKARTWASTV